MKSSILLVGRINPLLRNHSVHTFERAFHPSLVATYHLTHYHHPLLWMLRFTNKLCPRCKPLVERCIIMRPYCPLKTHDGDNMKWWRRGRYSECVGYPFRIHNTVLARVFYRPFTFQYLRMFIIVIYNHVYSSIMVHRYHFLKMPRFKYRE